MKICIICEGCYPYVTGGVSSWVQMLMTQMPEHEFVICAISADIQSKAISRYKLLDNVTGIYDIFLNSYQNEFSKHYKPYKMNAGTTKQFVEFIKNQLIQCDDIFRSLTDPGLKSISSFMMSYELLDTILEIYLDKYSDLDFTSFFWTTSIYVKEDYTRKDAERNIFANPFKRFQDMRFMKRSRDIEYVEFSRHIYKALTGDEKAWMIRHCDVKLDEYYTRINR